MNWFQPAWEQLTEDERMVLDRAFSICSSLTSITIPDSVSDVEANPFLECEKLKQINISPDHPYLALIDGVLFSKSDKRLVCYPYTLTKESYAIPNGILLIGDCAFCNCKFLTSITIPDSVTSIGVSAFCNCILLGSVAIPNSVTSIGSCAFSLCKSITSITIPNSVTSIENYTFYESSITSIEIPDSVTSIGESVFSNCLSLISVTIPDSVTSIGIGAFFDCPNLTVTVPRDSFAKQYCIDNGIPYTYPDALDWLNN